MLLNLQEELAIKSHRPDELTMVPWPGGRRLTLDVTVADAIATSHLSLTSSTPGELGERLTAVSSDLRENTFRFQSLSVIVQRFNMVAFRCTFSL